MGKLFGTDGIRGVVGQTLTAPLAYRIGQAAAIAFGETGEELSNRELASRLDVDPGTVEAPTDADAVIVRPATTARIVANATAEMMPSRTSPPRW